MSETLTVEPLGARIYINSFPKSGTHLAYLITANLAARQEPKHWIGSFRGNSWTTKWQPIDKIVGVIEGQPANTWMIGHMGYKPEFDEAFQRMNTCMIFVYRDLRDVAVSQTYHIEAEDDKRFRHPDKQLFMDLPDHTARLRAVIEGIDRYPGIIDRWVNYAPWLNVDWVFPVRFEDMRNYPEQTAKRVVNYVIQRTVFNTEGAFPVLIGDEFAHAIALSIRNMNTTEYSGSYRAGRVGDWRAEFTPELLDLFDELGGNDWLERLGYEPARKAEENLRDERPRIRNAAQAY